MKKWLLLSILVLAAVLLVACKPAEQPAEEAEPAEQAAPAPAPTPERPAVTPGEPAAEATSEGEAEAPEAEAEGDEATEDGEDAEPEKVAKAGLGVIFVTEMEEGLFRVKANDEKLVEHTFQRGSSITGKEIRVERELTFPAGETTLKFVVQDPAGMKAYKEHTMVFAPKSHHVIKIKVKDNPSTMALEILE